MHLERAVEGGRILAVQVGQRLRRRESAEDGREDDVVGSRMPRPLRQLDREGRPRAVPVATVQVRTPQAAGPTRTDKWADDAAVGAAGHREVRHPAGVQAVSDVGVERLIGAQHD